MKGCSLKQKYTSCYKIQIWIRGTRPQLVSCVLIRQVLFSYENRQIIHDKSIISKMPVKGYRSDAYSGGIQCIDLAFFPRFQNSKQVIFLTKWTLFSCKGNVIYRLVFLFMLILCLVLPGILKNHIPTLKILYFLMVLLLKFVFEVVLKNTRQH